MNNVFNSVVAGSGENLNFPVVPCTNQTGADIPSGESIWYSPRPANAYNVSSGYLPGNVGGQPYCMHESFFDGTVAGVQNSSSSGSTWTFYRYNFATDSYDYMSDQTYTAGSIGYNSMFGFTGPQQIAVLHTGSANQIRFLEQNISTKKWAFTSNYLTIPGNVSSSNRAGFCTSFDGTCIAVCISGLTPNVFVYYRQSLNDTFVLAGSATYPFNNITASSPKVVLRFTDNNHRLVVMPATSLGADYNQGETWYYDFVPKHTTLDLGDGNMDPVGFGSGFATADVTPDGKYYMQKYGNEISLYNVTSWEAPGASTPFGGYSFTSVTNYYRLHPLGLIAAGIGQGRLVALYNYSDTPAAFTSNVNVTVALSIGQLIDGCCIAQNGRFVIAGNTNAADQALRYMKMGPVSPGYVWPELIKPTYQLLYKGIAKGDIPASGTGEAYIITD